ncbi:MAG: hypothetical protein ACAH11_13290 [Sphingomonas sp.]
MSLGLILKSLAVAFGAMVVNVAASFLWVFFYSLAISPGHEEAFYQAYAMEVAPWCSVIAGIPILFAAGLLLARWLGRSGWRAGIGAGIAYVAIDFTLVAAMGGLMAMPGVLALSFTTKLAASAVGGALAARR